MKLSGEGYQGKKRARWDFKVSGVEELKAKLDKIGKEARGKIGKEIVAARRCGSKARSRRISTRRSVSETRAGSRTASRLRSIWGRRFSRRSKSGKSMRGSRSSAAGSKRRKRRRCTGNRTGSIFSRRRLRFRRARIFSRRFFRLRMRCSRRWEPRRNSCCKKVRLWILTKRFRRF